MARFMVSAMCGKGSVVGVVLRIPSVSNVASSDMARFAISIPISSAMRCETTLRQAR